MKWKIEWIDRNLITFVIFVDSCLSLCVSSNYAGTYGSGREGDESTVKPGHEQSPKQKDRASAWTPRHEWQPLGLFYSAARSFLGFVLSAVASHPPTRPPLWMVLQMICVQFHFTWANTASKNRDHSASFSDISLPVMWLRIVQLPVCPYKKSTIPPKQPKYTVTVKSSKSVVKCQEHQCSWIKEAATKGWITWRMQNYHLLQSFSVAKIDLSDFSQTFLFFIFQGPLFQKGSTIGTVLSHPGHPEYWT